MRSTLGSPIGEMRVPKGDEMMTKWMKMTTVVVACLLSCAVASVAAESIAVVSVVDDLGDTLCLSSPPQRIVSLAPSNTELLYALGLGPRMVGVTEYCNYPPAADTLPKVAGYSVLNLEMVVAAEPDLVVAARGNDIEGVQSLRALGVPVLALDIQSVDQLFAAVGKLGRLTGNEKEAAALADQLRTRIDVVQERLEGASTRPRVMWGSMSEPIYTAGAATLIDDIFGLAGGENLGRQAMGAWPQISLETVVAWQPEVIITTYHPSGAGSLEVQIESVRHLDGWKALPAVRTGRVHYVEADHLNRPGPRMIDALEELVELFHPELAETRGD